MANAEQIRLNNAGKEWKEWGPYLSERQWGTVREDYSESGDAWDCFTHDQARSRAYRWGEDGLAGISDDKQRLCFALALWNGTDPILKERLFGLTNGQGNHGEDVKEYYYYLESSPTHSYMKYLYKYPQMAYPYDDLIARNRERSRFDMEYELIDTGVFDDDRYFDVFVEYAKGSPDDILVKITAWNRGPEAATVHLLPTLWFRNTWAWKPGAVVPSLELFTGPAGRTAVRASHPDLDDRYLYCDAEATFLFTENETNTQRLFGEPNSTPFVKDAFDLYLVQGQLNAVNPAEQGTKAAAHVEVSISAGDSAVVRLRLTKAAPGGASPFAEFDETFARRLKETDDFYEDLIPASVGADERLVVRQALGGLLWSKQYYSFDLEAWLREHHVDPRNVTGASNVRNRQWLHMFNDDIISMPDKWEYPWYAAWDLAFHCVALAFVDIDFAKGQLDLMLRGRYLHPNGQIPAYEWNFGDVNPPTHAWATMYVYQLEQQQHGTSDRAFLEHAFQKLLLNFTWWLNRKDPEGRNVFEGGFLGLDNIGVFDRSAPLPTGGHIEQADGTAWMALFCQAMLDISLELAIGDPLYEEFAGKFIEHFFRIASSMDRVGDFQDELWDEEDGFFYDLLRLPDGRATRLKVHSLVGLLPLCASSIVPVEAMQRFPDTVAAASRLLERDPDLIATVASPRTPGIDGRRLLSVLDEQKLRRVLDSLLDEERFLSPHGVRSLSRQHRDQPFVFNVDGAEYRVDYVPAESSSGMFGGNSNWRGPVWFPVNILIVRAILNFYAYYGDDFKVECPTGSGTLMSLYEVAHEIARRLISIFLVDADGRRPVFGGAEKFQTDPHWRDNLLFYEYFHGDNGAGLGASHQTGWTGTVGALAVLFGRFEEGDFLGYLRKVSEARAAAVAPKPAASAAR